MKLILASNNPGKRRELRELLSPLGWEIVTPAELGIPECAEPHMTFVENALEKARHASGCANLPALADDSGLCVPALLGAPGIHSARYAQTSPDQPASDAQNNRKLIRALERHTDRRARYVCLLVFLRSPDDPQPLIAEGEWSGEIIDEARGSGGFGYDPHFFLPDLGLTAAELPAERKNRLSHRGRALERLAARLRCDKTLLSLDRSPAPDVFNRP